MILESPSRFGGSHEPRTERRKKYMKRTSIYSPHPSVALFIRTPRGLVPLDGQSNNLPLPENPAFRGPRITYGPYLQAVAGYFTDNSFRNLKRLLRVVTTVPGLSSGDFTEPDTVTITSEKHGALYNVSSMRMEFHGGRVLHLAINAAILQEQRAFLAVERRLLRNLFKRFPFPVAGLPRPLLSGSTRLKTGGTDFPLDLFVAEWFRNHHEFHLCAETPVRDDVPPRLHVWKPGQDDLYLNSAQVRELYRGAAMVLTSYLDTRLFRQIYPWHHAAGDFIVDESTSPVSVKLVTARGYRSLLPGKSNAADKMLGSLHFFINLTIRMRIDRIEGTGDLAWAGPEVLSGIISGFAEAWKEKERENPEVPGAREIFAFFLGLSPEERLAFAEVVAGNSQVEMEETDFLAARLTEHVRQLSVALDEFAGG